MEGFLFGSGFESYKYSRVLDSLNIVQDSSFYQDTFIIQNDDFPDEPDTLIICGQEWWEEKECILCSNGDPNGDKFHEVTNPEGTEENEKYDQLDINGDGLISSG